MYIYVPCLNCFNFLIAGLPTSSLRPLQLDYSASILYCCNNLNHITSIPRDFHWVFTKSSTSFKILVIIYNTLNWFLFYLPIKFYYFLPGKVPLFSLNSSRMSNKTFSVIPPKLRIKLLLISTHLLLSHFLIAP